MWIFIYGHRAFTSVGRPSPLEDEPLEDGVVGHGEGFEVRRRDLVEGHQGAVGEGEGELEVQVPQTREGGEDEERVAAARLQGPQTEAGVRLPLGAHAALSGEPEGERRHGIRDFFNVS